MVELVFGTYCGGGEGEWGVVKDAHTLPDLGRAGFLNVTSGVLVLPNTLPYGPCGAPCAVPVA